MAKENLILLILAAVLCCLNLYFGPLAGKSLASLFARMSSARRSPQRKRAGRHPPPGPDDESSEMRDAQMSKYR
jgi:hypothetical protein